MGTLISCHKTSKVSAKTVSVQITECAKTSTFATELEDDHEDKQKTVVTELKIGDGDKNGLPGLEHEQSVSKRASKENKPRPGIHRINTPPEKSAEVALDRSMRYDHLVLPGQVSPKDGSPLLGPRTEKTGIRETQNSSASPERRVPASNRGSYQDENSNIVQERTVATTQPAMWNSNKPTENDVELTAKKVQESSSSIYPRLTGYESRYPQQSHQAVSPRPNLAAVSNARVQQPPFSRSVRKILSDRNRDFSYSLEEAFQRNVPCSDELLEAAAVTGTCSSRLPQAPAGKYPVNWELKVMMTAAGVNQGTAEPALGPGAASSSASQRQGAGDDGDENDDGKAGDGDCSQPRKDGGNQHGTKEEGPRKSEKKATGQNLLSRKIKRFVQSVKSREVDPSTQLDTVLPMDTAGPLQFVPSPSTLSNSPDASDAGSDKSTDVTDLEPSQSPAKERVKGDGDGTHKTNRDEGQRREMAEKKNLQEIVLKTVEAKKPHMSYQAIREAVSAAILKLTSLHANGGLGKDLGGSEVNVHRTGRSGGVDDALPDVSCCLTEEPDQSIVFQTVDLGDESHPQDALAVPPSLEKSPNDKASQCVNVNEGTGSVLTNSQERGLNTAEGAGTTLLNKDGAPSSNAASSKEVERAAAAESQDWEVIPLHRVFGQTDLCASTVAASASPPLMHGVASRSVPPSVGVPFVEKNPREARSKPKPAILPEDQMISMALGKRKPSAMEPREQQPAEGAVPDGGCEDRGKLRAPAGKVCPETPPSAKTQTTPAKPERSFNRGIPGKSPRQHATTPHQRLQPTEDIHQNQADKNAALGHETSSICEEIAPSGVVAQDLPADGSPCLPPRKANTGQNPHGSRVVPKDSALVPVEETTPLK